MATFLSLAAWLLFTSVHAINFPANCDVACQASVNATMAEMSSAWISQNVSTDPFYANPTNLSSYKAGDIIRWVDIPSTAFIADGYSTPPATSVSRVLYMSEDIDGNPIPASGFVLLPYTNFNGDGAPLRTVVWTHGTAGISRQCAPSNFDNLYYSWNGPFMLVQQGYAVLAPDYAGQGSDIPQGFMYEAGALHALDVSFLLNAARTKLGNRITNEWVVIGHSEGGMTAWRVNEHEKKNATGGFLGAVSGSPALRPLSLIPQSWNIAGNGPVHDSVSIFFLQSVSKLYPSIKIEDYMSDILLSRLPFGDRGCLPTAEAIYGNLTLPQLYKNTTWVEHPDVIDWQKRYNGAGPYELAAPMLVLQGTADELVYANLTVWDFEQTCGAFASTDAELYMYPGLNHDFTFLASTSQYIPWIRDRFDHVPVAQGCHSTTVKPFGNA